MFINDEFKKQIIDCVKNVMTPARLPPFTIEHYDVVQVNFQNDITPGAFNNQVPEFVSELIRKGTIIPFLMLLKTEYEEQALVQELNKKLEKLYDIDQEGNPKLRSEFIDYYILRDSLTFIDRKAVKDYTHDLIHDSTKPLGLINGNQRTGKSYLIYYLTEVKEKHQCYNIIHVDLRQLNECNIVFAQDIAQDIDTQLGLNYSFNEESKNIFKITPFVNELIRFIDSDDEKQVIFIDHFDEPLSTDVNRFIVLLAKTIILKVSKKCNLILVGFENISQFDYPTQILKKDIELSNFNREEVDDYLSNLYKELQTVYEDNFNITEQEFLQLAEEKVDLSSLLNEEYNVEKIGRSLTDFYAELLKQLGEA